MATPETERNLLFGVVAFEMQRISREALVDAIAAWLSDQSRPIEQVLADQKALSPQDHSAVAAQLKELLDRNGNDPHGAPATFVLGETFRNAMQVIAQSEAPQTITQPVPPPITQTALDPFATFGQTATVAVSGATGVVGAPTSGGQRFRVIRSHARGGLGEVFVADDQELHREVALKEIQSRHADHPDSRARFLLEAEITGGLEHPGIVPVYGLGAYADGRPYYAMRFIRGDSFKEAIDRFHKADAPGRDPAERELELRQLLRRFVDVCNALEYAHSRGILHRDLKPGNIMLGKFGETLVVDWGLAKPLGRPERAMGTGERQLQPSNATGTAPTMMGYAIGTPQYMSPEQAAGKLDQLGPPSDVYSLGATLYTLLTGKAAFESHDIGEILKHVKAGIFPRPRDVKKQVPRALEAICLKAMALKPGDRYPTPRPLADDIEHWLADDAVSAYQEPWPERTMRWLRRHKAWAQAVAAAVLIVAVVGVTASLLINRAREREAEAHADAQQSFLQARRAVQEYFTQVSESKLLNVAGLQPLRMELLKTVLEHDQEFTRRRASDPSVRGELAISYFRAGKITQMIGAKADALAALEKARAIQEELARDDPHSLDVKFALSNTVNAIGDVRQEMGQVKESLADFQIAKQLRSELAKQQPDDLAYQRKLGNSSNNIATALARLGQFDEAKSELTAANDSRRRMADQHPDNPQLRRDLAQGYYNFGIALHDNSDLVGASKSLHDAVTEFRTVAAGDERAIDPRRELSLALRTAGDVDVMLGRFDEAQSAFEEARSLAEKLARQNPFLVELEADVAAIYVSLGMLKEETAEPAAAVDWLTRARDVHEQLVAGDPDSQRFQFDLASCQVRLGMAELATDALDAARDSFQAALATYNRLAIANPDDAAIQDGIAQTHRNIGLIFRAEQDYSQAIVSFDEARRVFEQLVSGKSASTSAKFGWADALLNIAVDQSTLRQDDAALVALGQAAAIEAEVILAEPQVVKYRYLQCEIALQSGLIELERKNYAGAREEYETVEHLLSELVESNPDNLKFQSQLGITLDKLALVDWQTEQYLPALEKARQATEHLRTAFDGAPQVTQYRLNLAQNYRNRAKLEREMGLPEVAVELTLARKKLWPANGDELFLAAKELARCSDAVDLEDAQLAADERRQREDQREAFARLAVETLNEAIAAGFDDFEQAAGDPALDTLRNRPDFPEPPRSDSR